MNALEWDSLQVGQYIYGRSGRRKVLKVYKKARCIVLEKIRPSWTNRDTTVYCNGDKRNFEK